MRILLLSNASYAPPRGGSTRSNLVWLRDLAAKGHECRVVCPPAGPASSSDKIEQDGITIIRIPDLARHADAAAAAIRDFQPDWALVSSEDLSHVLLRAAWREAPGRVVYVGHTPQWFPFGPASWHRDPEAAEIVRQSRAIVVIGQHMADYVRRYLGAEARVIHPPIYGEPPFPNYASFDRGDILMINPCAVKGIGIFLALAERFSEYPFAALRGWGTTSADMAALRRLPNVRLLEPVASIDEALSEARLLLMPSLWYEGFGLIAMEAMLRGLPVIASDSGGLKEAAGAAGVVVPVRTIERWEPAFDENHMPRPVLPAQDVSPWAEALEKLLTDERAYHQESRQGREAASRFVSALDAGDFEKMLLSLEPAGTGVPRRNFRVLLAHNSLYFPSHGGGDKSNRLLMEALAARGDRVRVVARIETFGKAGHDRFLSDLAVRGIAASENDRGAVEMLLNGVEVHTVTANPQFRGYFKSQVDEFDPDVIITSTDDPAQILFEPALQAAGPRVVHLVRATIAVPFGPDASSPDERRSELLRQADAIVGVSEYVAQYVREHGGMDAVHVPISLMDAERPARLGRFANSFVTITNPCAVKGIDIFEELARRMPQHRFAAVPTWGTNAEDRARLERLPNVTLLPPSDNIDDILRVTSVLLVPSLWAEARSRIVVEAQARGIPVIASDVGGIPEAKMGVPYLIPVRTIERYKSGVDENMVPVAEIPPQEIEPWEAALTALRTDPHHYEEIAEASRRAALDYIENLTVEPFARFLEQLVEKPKKARRRAASSLSADRQKLLHIRIRQRLAAAQPEQRRTFPFAAPKPPSAVRLFCFPFAGGGALFFRRWQEKLGTGIQVCPARLPGRETRHDEQPFDRMDDVLHFLQRDIRPHLQPPYAFFGHSMGATVAFELALRLRNEGLPTPGLLIVSGARAPQFRLHHKPQPDPPEDEFLEQIRRLEGVPGDVLARPELLELVLPTLRADTRLFRNYVYRPDTPLDIPIVCYRGCDDPNVRPEHTAGWRDQTTASFRERVFPGGHFFLQSVETGFLEALAEDLAQISERSGKKGLGAAHAQSSADEPTIPRR